ncbi:MAG: MBL fold metallo-hydrolase [Candidatus Paceibacterota bacterium]
MTINWYGQGCFKLQSGKLSIIVDPVEKDSGLSAPRSKPDILINTKLKTTKDGYDREYSDETTHVIAGPGEYEVKEVQIAGYPLKNSSDEKTLHSVFKVKVEDLSLGFLGDIKNFSDLSIIEELGELDILFIPAGGGDYIDQKSAAKIVRQISPRLLVPTHFKVKGLKAKVDGYEGLLSELGLKAEVVDKLSIKRKDLSEKMKVVALTL